MKRKEYDLIVVGGGAGMKLVRPSANLGKRVALIEKGALGGTCLNRGCIPSKMLIHPADLMISLEEATRFEFDVQKGSHTLRFSELTEYVQRVIESESRQVTELIEKHPQIDFYPQEAHFVDDRTLAVGEKLLTAEKIILSVGARPSIPPIPGLAETPYLDSTGALYAKKQPRKLIVIGGGYIATELGHFYGSVGTDVEFLVRSEFLAKEDNDVKEEFTRVFSQRFSVTFGMEVLQVQYRGGLFTIRIQQADGTEREIESDALLVATGVIPNSDRLSLENTRIATDARGYIRVDETLQTTVPGVYAFGDVIGRSLFRHTANYEGEYLFRTLIEQPTKEALFYPPIPYAVFSHPQIGGVGPGEQELQEQGVEYIVGKNTYAASAMGMALRSDYGFVKLLFERSTRRLLAARIIGQEAATMVHMLIAYMNCQATLDDMLRTIYIHPALPEIVRNAARKAKAAFEK